MNDNFIPPLIPAIPEPLIVAASKGKLVIFVGAGISKLAGGPSWEELSEKALEELYQSGNINFSEMEQLKRLDAKKQLSIAIDISKTAQTSIDFKKIIDITEPKSSGLKIYRALLNIGSVYVTTNYDNFLDSIQVIEDLSIDIGEGGSMQQSPIEESKERKSLLVIHRREDITAVALTKPGSVIHLHGSLKEPETMIISTRSYIEHYQDSRVISFLNELFRTTYTVLFVGYSLEETEILEHIIRTRTPKSEKATEKKHYWLYPVFSRDGQLLKHLKTYYLRHCDIEIIEFCKDEKGYEQLIDVINDWTRKIKVKEPNFLEKIKIIDEAIDG